MAPAIRHASRTRKETMRRIDLARRVGARDPAAIAAANLGSLLRSATWTAIRRAGSCRDALTSFLASPELQSR